MLTGYLAVPSSPIRSVIKPLTIKAAEILLEDLKGGNGKGMLVTMPTKGHLPFISIPHETCVKIMQTFME